MDGLHMSQVLRVHLKRCTNVLVADSNGKSDPYVTLAMGHPSVRVLHTMRAELVGDFTPCMTEIYLHIDARINNSERNNNDDDDDDNSAHTWKEQ